jgi:hypothetical protein
MENKCAYALAEPHALMEGTIHRCSARAPLTSGTVAPEIPVLLSLDNNTMRLRLTIASGARTERTKLATASAAASTAIAKSVQL